MYLVTTRSGTEGSKTGSFRSALMIGEVEGVVGLPKVVLLVAVVTGRCLIWGLRLV